MPDTPNPQEPMTKWTSNQLHTFAWEAFIFFGNLLDGMSPGGTLVPSLEDEYLLTHQPRSLKQKAALLAANPEAKECLCSEYPDKIARHYVNNDRLVGFMAQYGFAPIATV